MAALCFQVLLGCVQDATETGGGEEGDVTGSLAAGDLAPTATPPAVSDRTATIRITGLVTSIGEANDGPEYALAIVVGLAVSRERLYVYDVRSPAIRAFALSGEYIGEVGKLGPGPGEYRRPPRSIAVAPNGNVLVYDGESVTVYDANHEPLSQWRVPQPVMSFPPSPIAVTADGSVLVPGITGRERQNPSSVRWEVLEFDANRRLVGRRNVPPGEGRPLVGLTVGNGTTFISPPFVSEPTWSIGPSGNVLVGSQGAGEIRVIGPPGSDRTISVRPETVPVGPDEKRWHEWLFRDRLSRAKRVTGWGQGDSIPGVKPLFVRLLQDTEERVWVMRPGVGWFSPSCGCWRDTYSFDVFGEGGAYLGALALPAGVRATIAPSVVGDLLAVRYVNDQGDDFVKVYRIDMPASVEAEAGVAEVAAAATRRIGKAGREVR